MILLHWFGMQETKAVIFDVDGTLAPDVSWQTITRGLGASVDELLRIYGDYKGGELTYEPAKRAVIELWRSTGNANRAFFRQLVNNLPLDPAAERVVRAARESGKSLCLISGSVDIYTQTVARKLGIAHWYANTTLHWDEAGNLVDMDYELNQARKKLEQFTQFCREQGIAAHECIVVGDGENELELFKATGHGILIGLNSPEDCRKYAWKNVPDLAAVQTVLHRV